jgi:PBP1b-binding outer membrane lipoprotein LpoB
MEFDMKILLTTVAAAVIAAGASAAFAQDKPQTPAPGEHHRHHDGMRWHHPHPMMFRPMGTMINVEKSADGYKVRVMCSPKTAADDCMNITNKLLDRFPAAK